MARAILVIGLDLASMISFRKNLDWGQIVRYLDSSELHNNHYNESIQIRNKVTKYILIFGFQFGYLFFD